MSDRPVELRVRNDPEGQIRLGGYGGGKNRVAHPGRRLYPSPSHADILVGGARDPGNR